MDPPEIFHIRIRHACRTAVGGAAIAAVGLTTSATAACLTSVLFFVSTIAGTPENHQAFLLRSTSLTLIGASMGALAYAAVHAIAGTSLIAIFFTAIPFISFFASLRPDASLVPLPPVANVVLGLLTISRSGQPRSTIPRTLALSLLDAAVAYATAVLVNLPFPQRASDLGRRIIATELRQLGAHISSVATNTFTPTHHRNKPTETKTTSHTTVLLEHGLHQNALSAGLLDDDYVFLTGSGPPPHPPTSVGLERTQNMITAAEQSLAFLQHLRPFGRTRVSNYANLARAEQLLNMSIYEPHIHPSAITRWRNATAWTQLVDALTALVTKVSSLESVSYTGEEGSSRFSQTSLHNLFGEAYLPLWVSHYASCAAACAAMSSAMHHATCKDMFYLPGESQKGVRGCCPLDATIDPRKWRQRRAEMYYGFLLRYRSRMRNPGSSVTHNASVVDLRSLESKDMRRLDLEYNLRRRTPLCGENQEQAHNGNRRKSSMKGKVKPGTLAELQALSFFGVASHSLSEEIGHVQSAMVTLAASSEERSRLSSLRFLVAGFPILWKSVKRLATGNVVGWEVRFMASHSLLLITILALSLFLPFAKKFEAAEIAWVFSSAALAAQLSAEPTLFIGAIRIVATATGASLAFGFRSILDAVGRSSRTGLQYLMIPYIMIVTITFLLVLPPSFRYAGFLVIVTNAILLFCPRSTPECSLILTNQSEECFPNWQYAISRSVNVSIGVVLALLFHIFFWPRFANREAFRSLSRAFINAARLLGKMRRTYFSYGLVRSEWLREDSGPRGEVLSDRERSLSDGDIYLKDNTILSALREDLSCHVSKAMLTVKAEAGLWQAGPLRLSPLLPMILSDFMALDVSLSELAALLGRKPIFSASYGRSAHDHFIDPLLPHYETIQVSLNNLVGITHRIFEDRKGHSLKENSLDLYQAIAHLARMRSQLRCDAEARAKSFEQKDFITLNVRHRLSSWSSIEKVDQGLQEDGDNIATGRVGDNAQPLRGQSIDDLAQLRNYLPNLSVDDIVLYNTFSFIADGCLSAFVRIAATVLMDSESRLDARKKREKSKDD